MGGGRQATLPATGEPAWRAHNRLTQLQRPLSGSFLKGLPVPFRCFHADECTALSCFRFGIPLPNLAQGLGNDMWGDKVLSKTGAMHQRRHDQLRDELARACRDTRNFPIPAYWEEETRRFGGVAQQRPPNRYQPTPVFSRGLATIAERSLLRVQRYFSRRIHSAARDRLIQRVHDMEFRGGRQATLPATGEPAWRAHNRL